MAVTYKLIETVTVGSGGAASIEFTSIPQTYTDLQVVASLRSNRANIVDAFYMAVNGGTTTSVIRVIYGSGTSASAFTLTVTGLWLLDGNSNTTTANIFSSHSLYVPNYTGSTTKSFSSDAVMEDNATFSYQEYGAGLWTQTAPITSLEIVSYNAATILQYSSASLYGIKNS